MTGMLSLVSTLSFLQTNKKEALGTKLVGMFFGFTLVDNSIKVENKKKPKREKEMLKKKVEGGMKVS